MKGEEGLKTGYDITAGRMLTRGLQMATPPQKKIVHTPPIYPQKIAMGRFPSFFINPMVYKPKLGVGDTTLGAFHSNSPYVWC